MTTAETVQIALAAAVPIVTAIVGIVGIVFHDWRARRTQSGLRKLVFEDANRQVSFASEWWKTQRLLADSPEQMTEVTSRVSTWLEEASALVMDAKLLHIEEKPRITVGRLLMFYPLQRRAARVSRGILYVCLGVLVLSVGQGISDALVVPDRRYVLDDAEILVATAVLA